MRLLLNYVKLAFRLMARNPFFTIINMLGLAIGFASFFVLWTYSTAELKMDQYHQDFDRIARISGYWKWKDGESNRWDYVTFGFTKANIALRVKEDFPEVQEYTRIHYQPFFAGALGSLTPHGRRVSVSPVGKLHDAKVFKEERIIYADQNLFSFFTLPLVEGSAKTMLSEAGSVAISESQAIKFFGTSHAIGELLKVNDSITWKVAGVFRELPHNTHLNFNIVVSNTPYLAQWANAYFGETHTFVKLREGSSFVDFERKLQAKEGEYWANVVQTKPNVDVDLFLQPLKDIAFGKTFIGDTFTPRSKPLLTTFAVVSLIILAMAWVNYINLLISQNEKRLKELATRKINGAQSRDFFIQFMTESTVVNIAALLLALTILQFTRPLLKTWFNIELDDFGSLDSGAVGIILTVVLVSILLTAIYPSLAAQRRQLLSLYKRSKGRRSGISSSGLVVAQYAAAIALILWASIVFLQLDHILKGETGIDRRNVVVVDGPINKSVNHVSRMDQLKRQLMRHHSVSGVTNSRFVPGDAIGAAKLMRHPGSSTQIGFDYNGVDEAFIPLYGLKLLAGRNFVNDERGDAVIISRIAAERLGFENPADAIGARLEVDKYFQNVEWLNVEVVGVIDDYRSLSYFKLEGQGPMASNKHQSRGHLLTYKDKTFPDFLPERISVRIDPENLKESIAGVEREFAALFPEEPFDWSFLDDNVNAIYMNEQILRNQLVLFVFLSVVIACMGFTGVITHKVISMTKEIGLRKILGANLPHIARKILQPSGMQFGLGLLIGIPGAYYLGTLYIQKFTEQVALHWWNFALPVVLLILIMISAVAVVVLRAARNNPVEALKCD